MGDGDNYEFPIKTIDFMPHLDYRLFFLQFISKECDYHRLT